MDMSGVKVGDEVFVFEGYNRSKAGGYPGVVTEVRRVLFTVECEGGSWLSGDFRKDTGYYNEKNSRVYVMTPEEIERNARRTRAISALEGHRLEVRPGCKLTTEQIEAMVKAIEG